MQNGQMYGRENEGRIVMSAWQESETHFLFIYFIDSKKAWHYSFKSVMISKAELIPLDSEIPDILNHYVIIPIIASELSIVL